MRPQRLEVEGFTAFRQPVTVDFAGADLFALVGPTGAGKTSLLEAVTFALYGSVPRLDDRRAVAPIISQNLTEARLRLDFGVGADTYTVARVVRASRSGASTKEARLERGGEVLAGTADEVGAAVTELLGLTYDHFTTCVSLPQGEFARFLHDKPRDRQDLLVRLLDLGIYDQVASTARQRAAHAASQVEVLDGQLARLAAATPERLDTARAQVATLAGLAGRLAEVRPDLDRLAEQQRRAEAEAERTERQLSGLRDVRPPDGVDELSQALASAAGERHRLAEAEEEAAAGLAEAEACLAELPARSDLRQLHDALTRRADVRELVTRGEAAAEEATVAVDEAERREAEAEATRERCAGTLERLRVERRAHALVPELRLGESCPVCRQTVEVLPEVHAPDLAAAETALARSEQQLKEAARQLSEARTHHARVDEKLARVRQEAADLDALLAASGELLRAAATALAGRTGADPRPTPADAVPADPVAAAVPGAADGLDAVAAVEAVDACLAAVTVADGAVAEARKADRAARQARAAADRRCEALRQQESEARRAFDQARDRLAALEPPAPERHDLAADWQQLVAWAERKRPDLEQELAGHRDGAAEARRAAGERLDEIVAACRAAGVAVRAPVAWPGEAVAAAHARAEEEVHRIEADLAEAERLRGEVAAATRRRQVADGLAGHLAANRFEKWLLDEAVHRLVGGASTILGELTGGGYALSVDRRSGAFTVIDHANASQPRPARTLSGGETFLASLALALSLADQVAELAAGGAARLESLFLDEGFGTLDADTLDVVATALDELGARGRMVGVVTHVRDLAERLPVRFEVRKVGGTATVERVDA